MAKKFFTTLPDKAFMRQTRFGGRGELLFSVLGIYENYDKGLGIAHFVLFRPLR